MTAPDFSILGDVNSLGVYTWVGGAGDWASGVAANWQTGGASAAWVNGKDVAFNAGGDLAIEAAGVSATVINISGSAPVTLTGGALTASSMTAATGSVLNINGASSTITGNVDLTDASLAGGGLSFGGVFGANISAGTKTISTALSGNGLFSKLGAGELILSSASTHTGGTGVGAGTLTTGANEVLSDTTTLQISAAATFKLGGNETVGGLNAIYGSFIDLQNNTLTSGGSGLSFTNGATITGTGALVKNGTGQMYLNNATNSFSGGLVLNDGSIAFTSSGNAGAGGVTNSVFGTGPLTLNGGTVTSSSSGSGRNIYNNVFLNGDVQFGTTSWGTTNVTLNTSTSIDQTKTSNNVTFPQSAVITVSTTGTGTTTLQKDLTINTIAYVDWYQPINGNYRITKSGTGAYSLSNNYLQLRASNNIAGVTVSSGLLTYKNRNAFGSGTLILKDGVAIGQDGSINNTPLTGNDQIDRSVPNDISIEGNVAFGTGSTANHLGGNINLNGGDRSITVANTTYLYGNISNGALTVFDTSPSRTLHLLASNSYTGGTTHNGGILSLGHDNALGGGGLVVFSNNSYTNVSTNVTATITTNVTGGVTNKTTNFSTNFATNVTIASNRLTITSDRILTNAISLNSGALYTIEAPQIVTTTVDSGTGVTNSVTNNPTFVINGSISGSGAILKSGPGLLRLAGDLGYSGDTTVSSGTLERITNNISASITTNTIAVSFSNTPANGTYTILPGALNGSQSVSFTNLSSGQKATFSAASPASVMVSSKASQTITGLAATDTKTTADTAYALSVTPGASTGSLTFSSDNSAVATISSAGVVTIVGVGTTTLRVNQAGDANYLAAAEVTQTLTVTSAGPTFESAYPGVNLADVAPNGLTYLVNYAFGGSSTNQAKLPVQDTSDPTKLKLVAYVRTNNTAGMITVKGQTGSSLSSWDATLINGVPASDNVGAPEGTQKQIFSVDASGDRQFLRLKVTK